jgi:hypothetical protein
VRFTLGRCTDNEPTGHISQLTPWRAEIVEVLKLGCMVTVGGQFVSDPGA